MSATLPFSLKALRSHAIFVPPKASSSDDGWELVDASAVPSSSDGLPAPKSARIALRDKDLLVAFGREVRMTSLAGEGWEVHGATVGGYKTLKSPHLTFPILQLLLNPSGRLLAVVGHHQLVILVLPRAGFASSVGGEVACRSFPVDEYQHSPSSASTITKVRWHPWGEGGNSLWVLTSDGKLFEYDVLRPQDPVQTFHFLPEKATTKRAKFSAIDPLSQYATSFTFSAGAVDFAPLMAYVLMANGDIYTMGPVLPLHAEVPATYLQALQSWTAERTRRLEGDTSGSAEHASLVGRAALQTAWVEAVVRQAAAEGAGEGSPKTTPRRGFGLRDPEPSPPAADRPPPPPGMVRVHPPHLTASGGPAPGVHRPLMRQGPVLFDPAPQDVGNGDEMDEQAATDVTVVRSEGVNVVAIAWSGGRVDLGVEIDTPGPRWMTTRDPAPVDVVLPIVESVLVSFPSVEQTAEVCAPAFVLDPVHTDVLYVQHAFGVDAISVAPWTTKLASGGELAPSDVACLVEAGPSRPIIGVVTFCNITLGYGLLALASTGQLAAVEMDFRVQDRGDASSVGTTPAKAEPTPTSPPPASDSQSLLKQPLDYDALLAAIRAVPDARAAVRKLADGHKQLSSIGPDHLRALAEAAAQVHKRAEAIRTGSNAIERRADLASAEYARQLKVLREAAAAVRGVRAHTAENAERTQRLADEQAQLGARLDALLGTLMAEYRPQVGEVERRWFDELERLRARTSGARGRPGLAQRAQVLKEQLGVVRPAAVAAAAAAQADDKQAAPGHRQLKPLEAALNSRSDELARIMRKMEGLSVRVDAAEVEEE